MISFEVCWLFAVFELHFGWQLLDLVVRNHDKLKTCGGLVYTCYWKSVWQKLDQRAIAAEVSAEGYSVGLAVA